MASFFFNDYHFPSELYNRETGDFTAPIRTLLDFAPHILQELPKEEKDQKPIHSEAQDSWTKSFLTSSSKSYLSSLLTSERTKAVSEFIVRCGNEYMRSISENKREEERFERFKQEERERRRQENKSRWFNRQNVSSSSEDKEEEEKMKERLEKEKLKKKEEKLKEEKENDHQVSNSATTNNAIMTSAVAASVLSLSLYSTYQASVKFSDVSFHNQLELIITQVRSIIQSTEVWIEEHEKMDDKVPSQLRIDVAYLKELIETLVKLDPRANKKVEAAGWGAGAIGGLSALGGFALGSAAVATGGAALALGGIITMVSAKAQYAGKSKLGVRLLMENQVREKVKAFENKAKQREKLIQDGFEEFSVPNKRSTSKAKAGDKR
ncbi:hypothetical protein INT48_004347 [Thamnidium elegans]|uniref:Uncharacterized protein n=1 Tax=Thamnidium elegans TaxID=101142 RepID=A0A8H7SK34_9FUNG|nr:hypothetical protein INT48_004347 [Thamnidium elegans]